MTPTNASELEGDALQERAAELDIKGRSSMNADDLRAAVAKAEAEGDSGGSSDESDLADSATEVSEETDRADVVRERQDEDVPESPMSATFEENQDLEHSAGGVTTRDDPLDQGVPMVQGSPEERVGPEDAIGLGAKRGDYETRVEPKVHEAVRIDGGSGAEGPIVATEGGGFERLPHTRIEPQYPRVEDVGDEEGLKGGVETDPRS